MAVQPVHRTRAEMLDEALGARVPITVSGRYTLYYRAKSPDRLLIHGQRHGANSAPVGRISELVGTWAALAGRISPRFWKTEHEGATFDAENPVAVFE